ncbi:MAG: hypothetical protein PHS41_08130 [Victivallaceae bacterium]|nr:hypothetical protein [Victivallaceae bacterium]
MANGIINRVKRTWGLWHRVSEKGPVPVDSLVKMNLAPLMGRRDAAYDQAEKLAFTDLFVLSDKQREAMLCRIGDLIGRAIGDTRNILVTLSSPDTLSRERKLLSLLETQCRLIDAIYASCMTDQSIGETREVILSLAGGETLQSMVNYENLLADNEVQLLNFLRELFSASRNNLVRYREYASKSFSKGYAARYNSARDEYGRIFAGVEEDR